MDSRWISGIFNIELAFFVGCIVALTLAVVLMLIKVPYTEYSRRLAFTKNTLALSLIVVGALFARGLDVSDEVTDFSHYASVMMLVITGFTSSIMSFSLINLLDEKALGHDRLFMNVLAIAIVSLILMRIEKAEGELRLAAAVVSFVLFLVQCIWYIVVFDRIYKRSLNELEQFYDDDQYRKIRWIRFCFIIMMLTQMFVLVYLFLPHGLMKIYVTFYSLFMLYLVSNFISFLGSHKLLLDAFAYKALSGEDIKKGIRRRKGAKAGAKDSIPKITEKEMDKLSQAVETWVAAGKYRECDKSREQVASELGTTRDRLQVYFNSRVGVDFRTWRTQLRIEDAKRILIENKDIPAYMVGEMCGFSDRSNFHRQFTQLVGCSPKEWRERGESDKKKQ